MIYYHLPFLARAFPEGKRVAVYGRLEEKAGVLRITHPETETI
jgi:RecG-like helicase